MLDPQEQADKKAERRAALLSAEQARPEEFKMSSKKKKRMDKFIDKQLKKERRVQLLQDISYSMSYSICSDQLTHSFPHPVPTNRLYHRISTSSPRLPLALKN